MVCRYWLRHTGLLDLGKLYDLVSPSAGHIVFFLRMAQAIRKLPAFTPATSTQICTMPNAGSSMAESDIAAEKAPTRSAA